MNGRGTFRITGIAAALIAGLAPAQAAEIMAPAGLNTASSMASVGVGHTSDDGRRFGQYNGINEDGSYGLLDFNLVKREDATGTWLQLSGRNVGLDNRQLRLEHSRQGNWGYFLEYSEIPRFEPYSVTTAVTGIGTPNLTIPTTPTTGIPVDLETKREAVGLGFDKHLFGNWDFQVRFKNEEKDGSRIFARGTSGTPPGVLGGPIFGRFEFAPEPINSTTRQIEAKLGYSGAQLQLSGGYYGTMYNNQYNGLNFTGGLAALNPNPPGPCPNSCSFTPIALPPDNQSHQFHLAGGYGFTPTTRGNFKVAHAKATQDDPFVTGVNVPLAPGIGNNLQGRVDTTLAQAGLTSRPIPKLSLLADVRYEDRDDKTPELAYRSPAGTTDNGRNEPRSIRTTTGKAEASYALPNSFRLTGGIGYEEKKRNTSSIRIVSYRETTDELSYRVELRRIMSETLTGALSYVHSDRDGSPWIQTLRNTPPPNTGSNLIAPIHLADRKRDKVRLSANWMPIEPLTLTVFVDAARDDYSARDGSTIGPMEGRARNYSIDAGYAFTQQWQANAWYSRNDTRAEQTTCAGASNDGICGSPTWGAMLRNFSDNVGVGLRGKPHGRVEIGADASYSDIKDEYRQAALLGSIASTVVPPPDISTKLTRVNLFGRYVLDKSSGVRLDYIFDRYKTDDWTWTTWMYADGTRLTQDPNQSVNFVGISYYYRWQ